jgi:hypothetical protein
MASYLSQLYLEPRLTPLIKELSLLTVFGSLDLLKNRRGP